MREKRYRERNPMPLSDACNRRLFSTRTFFLHSPLTAYTRGCIFLSFFCYYFFFYRRHSLKVYCNGLFLVDYTNPAIVCFALRQKPFRHIYTRIYCTQLYFNFIFYEYFETVLFSWLTPVTAAALVCKERINCSHFL